MGDVAASINSVKPAREIIEDMVAGAKQCLLRGDSLIASKGKL